MRDPIAFLAGLRDPHQFGTGEPLPVPQQPTLIERIASWKAAQRRRVRDFLRAQTTPAYRQARRADDDTTRVSQRVTLQVSTFAQVPLLNPDQLVTSWRELLPHLRDPEMRRLPLDLPGAGVYVVEAVHERRRAYTVVVVSDVGVVAKASPGQMLLFAADRHSGDPRAELRGARAVGRRHGGRAGARRPTASWTSPAREASDVPDVQRDAGRRVGQPARRGAVRRSRRHRRPGQLGVPAAAAASWPRSSTPTSRSTARATPCT